VKTRHPSCLSIPVCLFCLILMHHPNPGSNLIQERILLHVAQRTCSIFMGVCMNHSKVRTLLNPPHIVNGASVSHDPAFPFFNRGLWEIHQPYESMILAAEHKAKTSSWDCSTTTSIIWFSEVSKISEVVR
jgi:hypothetical protein